MPVIKGSQFDHLPVERLRGSMTGCEQIDAMVAERDRHLAWHKANNPNRLTEKQILAYGAGFDAGWQDAIRFMERNPK